MGRSVDRTDRSEIVAIEAVSMWNAEERSECGSARPAQTRNIPGRPLTQQQAPADLDHEPPEYQPAPGSRSAEAIEPFTGGN